MNLRQADLVDCVQTTVEARKNGHDVQKYVDELKRKAKLIGPKTYA